MAFGFRFRWAAVAMAAWLCAAPAPSSSVAPAHAPLRFRSPVQDKNFYALSMMEGTVAVSRALRSDTALAKLGEAKRAALAGSCAAIVACYADALKLSDAEIAAASDALRRIYKADFVMRGLGAQLLASGALVQYQSLGGAELVAKSWEEAAHGMNGIIDVYGLGKPPRYPAIDSVSYDVKLESYGRLVRTVVLVMAEDKANLQLFFQPTLRFALGLLDVNHRDEAGRFEPMEAGENRAAVRRAATIGWTRFPYSAIVVPGSGNDSESVALSAWGKLRLTLAVRRYREGKAPFLVVSGGYVHPSQTAHCEAMEMKRSLIRDYGIPEDAILIDPHARHTTTNLRNAVREFYRYGFPFDKKVLVTTDQYQSTSIGSAAFSDRCQKELGYQPALALRRVSPFDLEFVSNIQSLQFDARDPLDP